MKTKERREKNKIKQVKITIKNILILLVFVVFALFSVQFYFNYFANSKTYGKENEIKSNQETKISNASEIDLDKIIQENSNENKKEEIEKKETVLEYITKYKTNNELPKGMIQVVQEGREGKQEIVIKKIYENGEINTEEQLSAKVTKAAVNKIVEVGGANFSNKYTIKIGDTLYVTSTRLSVMVEANEDSQKIATLIKDDKLKLIAIENEWYKISSGNTIGFVKADCTTYIDPNKPIEEEKPNVVQNTNPEVSKQKEQNIGKLSFEIKLNSPSGLTIDQFKKVLTDNKDTNKVLSENAQYFYYIEEQYNINGLFVAGMAIHESAWGTSKIARDKKNLFGYGAYDSNPYNGAYTFTSYSESIDLIARVLVKYYLNPAGTSIYGGEKATGTYYNGPTLSGVNTRYATDKNWANAVYKHMTYLENKI